MAGSTAGDWAGVPAAARAVLWAVIRVLVENSDVTLAVAPVATPVVTLFVIPVVILGGTEAVT